MTVNQVPPVPAEFVGAASKAPPRKGRGIGVYLLFATLSWGIPSAAAPILVQAILAQLDDAHKVELTAVVSTVSSIVGVIAGLLVGAMSDKTRSRFGARKPWILGTALFAAGSLAVMLVADTFPLILASLVAFQAGLASMVVALSALLPDHVPAERLGRTSSLIGIGSLLGLALGGVVASVFLGTPRLGLAALPWLMVIAAVVGWFLIPKSSTLDRPKERISLSSVLLSVKPPLDRDFWLVFLGRLFFLTAMLTIFGFQLFVLTDHYRATEAEAGSIIALAGIVLAAGAAVSTLVFGVLSDRLQVRKPFIMAAGLVLALATLLLFTSDEPSALLLFAGAASLAYGTYISVDQALMVQVLPDHDAAAKDLGFLTVANTAPGIVAPGLAALLLLIGGYPAIFIGAGAIAILSIVFIIPIKRVR